MRLTLGSVAAVVIGLSCCVPATAQVLVPIISGEYVSTTWVYCQPTLNVGHSNGAVDSVTLTEKARTTISVEHETYDPSSGTVTSTGVKEKGSSLLLNDSVNGVAGSPFAESGQTQSAAQDSQSAAEDTQPAAGGSRSVPYSNDIATVTINGTTYHVIWGLRKKEVAQYFALLNLDGKGCVTQSEKVRR